ncbi:MULTISPECIES: hypothetical protein [Sphingobium]|nr:MULTISPECIES: hypothetical protein [Sphingobium]KYC30928.1 hypothetical protein A0J57_18220 [Sphingobium sp. 22B]OAP30460.1 hypothetical protein A8O16_18510 [Sphingobium sp. 20006FA]
MKSLFVSALALSAAVPALAQQPVAAPVAATAAPMLIAPPQVQQATAVLPANTEITLALNDTISTKGKRWTEGDNFDLTVTHNVMLGNYVIIPKGSRGVGRISWLTNKGAFGKSGKMEIDLEYVEVGGRRIPLSGHYRQEGEGNTVATVGTVIAAGVFAGFVTGKSGTIPAGRELTAHTKEDLPVAFAGPMTTQTAPVMVQPMAVQPAVMTVASPPPVAAPAGVTSPSSSTFHPPASGRISCQTCQ